MEVSEKDIQDYARNFVDNLSRDIDHATIVALQGELGAGKTTFSKYLARALGVEETVTSPTFVIQKVYKLTNQKFERLVHIDAYRLEGGEELKDLGWGELLAEPENLIVIEWPEKVGEIIPAYAMRLQFETINETTRKITHE